MDNKIAKQLRTAGKDIQYDAQCKKVLGQKTILSWILKYVVEEFRNMSLEEIGSCLTGKPDISEMSVDPEETDARVTLLNTENSISGEGMVCYDIRFDARLPECKGEEKGKRKLLIDLEAQKKYNPGYQIATRGIYYGARMISAQSGTEFNAPKYDNIKKIYSIWICMNAPKKAGNTITRYRIEKEDICGTLRDQPWAYDKMTVVVVALNERMETDHTLLRMLNTLLSPEKDFERKKTELEQEFQIRMQEDLKEEVKLMCNLSEYVLEVGMQKGRKQGRQEGILLMKKAIKLHAAGKNAEEIAGELQISRKQVKMMLS